MLIYYPDLYCTWPHVTSLLFSQNVSNMQRESPATWTSSNTWGYNLRHLTLTKLLKHGSSNIQIIQIIYLELGLHHQRMAKTLSSFLAAWKGWNVRSWTVVVLLPAAQRAVDFVAVVAAVAGKRSWPCFAAAFQKDHLRHLVPLHSFHPPQPLDRWHKNLHIWGWRETFTFWPSSL